LSVLALAKPSFREGPCQAISPNGITVPINQDNK